MSTSEPLPAGSAKAPTNAKTIAAVVVVLAFIAGVLIGVVGDRVYSFHFRFSMRGRQPMTKFIVTRLDRELKLTPQQRDEVTRILEARRQHIDGIMAAVRPQIRREIDTGNAEIEKILTPEQRTKFEKMKMRMLPRRDHNWMAAPGRMPGHPPLSEPPAPAPTGTEQAPQQSPAASPHP